MKNWFANLTMLAFASFLLAACGDDSSTTNSTPKISDADYEADSYRELPSCTESHDGETAYVVDQDQGYICKKGKWVEDDEAVEIRSSSSEGKTSVDAHAEEDDPASYVPEKIVPIKSKTITGFAQKGPFKAGATVDIFELELDGKTFAQTGKSFTGKVSNDSGAFKISNVSLKSQYALLRVTGYFKSEINDESVHGTLSAVTDLSKRENVNVNILTHLEYDRVLYLLNKGMNFTSAKKQAEREVLAAFGIEGNFKNTEDMNVLDETESDAPLIAISKMLLAGKDKGTNRDEEDLSDLLTKIALDLEDNGEWENVGGRDNSPGDYCPWDNKWQIATRAVHNMDFNEYTDDRCGCDENDLVCRKICHFVQSWRIVGRYCTSAIDDEIICNWDSDYRDRGVVCTEFSKCRNGEWFKASQLEADTYKWSKGKDGEIKKGDETGIKYKYDAELGEWRKISALDTLLNVCTKKHIGEMAKLKDDSSMVYYCDGVNWREATKIELELEIDTKGLVCNKNGEILSGKENPENKYVCDAGTFRIATAADTLYGFACVSYNEGKTSGNLVCENGHFYGLLKDERDGQTYRTVAIGSQIWMAENLAFYYNVNGASYGVYANPKCDSCGLYYSWEEAMDTAGVYSENGKGCSRYDVCSMKTPARGICPTGWHLPDTTEWNALFAAVGGQSTAGRVLKSQTGWYSTGKPLEFYDHIWNGNGNGTDAFGFSALPAGAWDDYEGRIDDDSHASFWSSNMYVMSLSSERDDAGLGPVNRFYRFSVRCLRD